MDFAACSALVTVERVVPCAGSVWISTAYPLCSGYVLETEVEEANVPELAAAAPPPPAVVITSGFCARRAAISLSSAPLEDWPTSTPTPTAIGTNAISSATPTLEERRLRPAEADRDRFCAVAFIR